MRTILWPWCVLISRLANEALSAVRLPVDSAAWRCMQGSCRLLPALQHSSCVSATCVSPPCVCVVYTVTSERAQLFSAVRCAHAPVGGICADDDGGRTNIGAGHARSAAPRVAGRQHRLLLAPQHGSVVRALQPGIRAQLRGALRAGLRVEWIRRRWRVRGLWRGKRIRGPGRI